VNVRPLHPLPSLPHNELVWFLLRMDRSGRVYVAQEQADKERLQAALRDPAVKSLREDYVTRMSPLGLLISYQCMDYQEKLLRGKVDEDGLPLPQPCPYEKAALDFARRHPDGFTATNLRLRSSTFHLVDPAPLLDHMATQGLLIREERQHARNKRAYGVYRLPVFG